MEQVTGWIKNILKRPEQKTTEDARPAELANLSVKLTGEGFNLTALRFEFNRGTVIGTTNPDLFRYLQLNSELSSNIPVATVTIGNNFSGKEAAQAIIDQACATKMTVSDQPYGDMEDCSTNMYTIAVKVEPGLETNHEVEAFTQEFRSRTQFVRSHGIVLYQELGDVPREIQRCIGRIAKTQ